MPEYKWDLQTDDLKWNTMISAGSDLDPPRTHTQQDFRPPWKVSKPPPLRGNFVKIPWFWYISLKRPISQNSRGFFGNFEISAPFSRRKLSPPKCWPPHDKVDPVHAWERGSGIPEHSKHVLFSASTQWHEYSNTPHVLARRLLFLLGFILNNSLSHSLSAISFLLVQPHAHNSATIYIPIRSGSLGSYIR